MYKENTMRVTDSEISDPVQVNPAWGIGIGILMIVLGAIAIARPFFASIASALAFGWIFVIAGIVQITYALQSRRDGHIAWKLIISVLYVLAGILIVVNPLQGVLTLTLVLGITIFLQSAIQVVMAFRMRPSQNWGWVLLSGIIGIILGIFIWSTWPFNADWIIGTWVGVNLSFDGIWILALSAGNKPAVQ